MTLGPLSRRLRSLRTRLVLSFFAATVVAVGVVLVYVTPRLEDSLREQKLRDLRGTASAFTPRVESIVRNNGAARLIDEALAIVSDRTNTRVTLLLVNTGTEGLQVAPFSDSRAEPRIEDLRFAVAERAARAERPITGTESSDEGELGQVALPIRDGAGVVSRVIVFSSPLSDVEGNVALVRRQILEAGGLVLLLALAGAFLVSRSISRPVRQLERGAEQVTAGDFTATFPTRRHDELGQLARALDAMQQQLGQADSARKRFVATASHELRTPIFSLGGFLELLEDEDLDEETRRAFVRELREQVARLGKLATDLLDLSRLEAHELDLRPEPTDVDLLVRAVTREFGPALDKHDSQLELRLSGRRIEAVCDPERVAQVLRILIDNALTHTPSGTDVAVTAERENGAVRLIVRDTGPGIDAASTARIFEPFFTSDDAQGSGLGLAIARELAARMDGRLTVDPTPGATTFALELPG